mgnify:CR=1 FL=1
MCYLRLDCLCSDAGYRVGVTGESVDAGFTAYVPHSTARVSAGRQQHVYGGVDVYGLTRRQVSVIMTDNLNNKHHIVYEAAISN